jgi:hypothetical protein
VNRLFLIDSRFGLQLVFDWLSRSFLAREFDSSHSTLFFAAGAENHIVVRIFDQRSFLFFFFFKFEYAEFAVVYACSADDAFFIVYYWAPMYLASRNTMIFFFRHSFSSPFQVVQ